MQRTPTCENCRRIYELKDQCLPLGNRIPLLLPCGHTFCEGCLLKVAKDKKSAEIACFKCEEKVQLHEAGDDGVRALLPNIYLLGVLLYNRRISFQKNTGGAVGSFSGVANIVERYSSLYTGGEKELAGGKASEDHSKILCDECNSQAATCQCKGCKNSRYCENCFKQVHAASKSLMKHKSIPVQDQNANEMLCKLHERKLEFYDQDTSEPVCAICIISEKCRGHDVMLLSEVTANIDDGVDDIIVKAKDTLSWWELSRASLRKSLPDMDMEANILFDEIHSKFNHFHTILLKRQYELMTEVTEKVSNDGSIYSMLKDLSSKIKSLTSLLNDAEDQEKNIVRLKNEDIKKKLNEYCDVPCIVKGTSSPDSEFMKMNLQDDIKSSIEHLGKIENENERFTLLKSCDVSQQLKEQLRDRNIPTDSNVEKTCPLTWNDELVCVTDILNPADFKVQRVSDKERLHMMMTDLNKHCRHSNQSKDLIHEVEEGQIVAAQFLSDNNWYRGCIVNKHFPEKPNTEPTWSNGIPVQVVYIDYGNSEWLPFTRLRQLPKMFIQTPKLAVTCALSGIIPPGEVEQWPERSKKALTALTGDRPMLMDVCGRVGCKLLVDLRKPDDDEPTQNEDRPSSVRDALVFFEVASFSSVTAASSVIYKPVKSYKHHAPLPKGNFVDVTVTHVEDPDAIYVQKLDSPVSMEQERLQILYNSKNRKGWKIEFPYKNMVCSAKFSVDLIWYRAKVLNVNTDDTAEVEYVDFGNHETIPFSELRKIPDMYLELPRQCVKVKLYGVTLPVGESSWSFEVKKVLHDWFFGKPLVAVMKDLEDTVSIAQFFDTSTEVDIDMNNLVAQFLVTNQSSDDQVVSQGLNEMIEQISIKEKEEKSGDITLQMGVGYPCPVIPDLAQFSATGVHVDDNSNIFLNVMGSDDSLLSNIMQQLNLDPQKFVNSPKSTKGLLPNQAMIAKFSSDKFWYRVEIVRIVDDINVDVRFVDFGNTEVTNVNNIFTEPMLADVPGQCIHVKLAGVKPLVEGKWSNEAITLLREFIVSEVVEVELMDRNSPDGLLSIIYCNDGNSINDILLEKNLVKSEASTETNKSNEQSLGEIHVSRPSSYVEQCLPKKGVKFDVMVTQVDQPDTVYIQRLPLTKEDIFYGDKENDDTLKESYNHLMNLESLSETINMEGVFGSSTQLETKPFIGMPCICKYTSDGLYYRARVECLDEGNSLVQVCYIDYGTREVVPIESLTPIPPMLTKLPMQSCKTYIAGISPCKPLKCDESVDVLQDNTWSSESMKHFYSIVANKRLVAEVVESTTEHPMIHLYEPREVESKVNLVLVGEIMKNANLAEFIC